MTSSAAGAPARMRRQRYGRSAAGRPQSGTNKSPNATTTASATRCSETNSTKPDTKPCAGSTLSSLVSRPNHVQKRRFPVVGDIHLQHPVIGILHRVEDAVLARRRRYLDHCPDERATWPIHAPPVIIALLDPVALPSVLVYQPFASSGPSSIPPAHGDYTAREIEGTWARTGGASGNQRPIEC